MPHVSLTEQDLRTVVHAFYDRVRRDPTLGPVFEDAVDDWSAHLDKLTAFWSSVMLSSGRYKGDPMGAHLRHLDRITPEQFDLWLALWARTTDDLLPAPAALALQLRAARIADSLKLALFFRLAPHPNKAA